MQERKAESLECPVADPVERLMQRLREEGFTTDQSQEDWEEFGEIIFRRDEKRKQQDWLETHVHRRHLSVSHSERSRSVSKNRNSESDTLLELPSRVSPH